MVQNGSESKAEKTTDNVGPVCAHTELNSVSTKSTG